MQNNAGRRTFSTFISKRSDFCAWW